MKDSGYSYTSPVEVEIDTDPPVRVTLIFHETPVGTIPYHFSNRIVSEGRLSCSTYATSVRLTLYDNGELGGEWDLPNFYGTLSLRKKSK